MIQNLKAFLDAIAYAEGTSNHPLTKNNGYDVIVTGVDGPEIFTDYSTHPFANGRKPKDINGKGLYSTAAGRYQFMRKDWAHYRTQLGLPDFGPDSQDRWALQLIKERRAIPDIETGHFRIAIGKVSNLWASLPGAGYGQPERKLSALEGAYEQAGGSFA